MSALASFSACLLRAYQNKPIFLFLFKKNGLNTTAQRDGRRGSFIIIIVVLSELGRENSVVMNGDEREKN